MEFGVRDGRSLLALVNRSRADWPTANIRWHGFDSWRGLPTEHAAGSKKRASSGVKSVSSSTRQRIGWRSGRYSVQGTIPTIPRALQSRVRLHSGWFNNTVGAFLDSSEGARGALAFAHLDADVYESTRMVLHALGRRCKLRVGTVLAFDELFGSELVEQHEWRALSEAARCYGFRFEFVSWMAHAKSAFGRAAVQITRVQPACTALAVLGRDVAQCKLLSND